MHNFKINNPTVVHFGKNVIQNLGEETGRYGNKILFVYGTGSIKSNGIYDAVMAQLSGHTVIEYSGIKPNPVVEDVDRAAEIGRKEGVHAIVAVGGGSVIDSAKVMSVCIPGNVDAWKIMTREVKAQSSIPLIAVLTLAATGTEMNGAAVLTNPTINHKIGFVDRHMFPRHSFLDPQFTVSVPKDYTAYGIVDLMAHVLENYFGEGEATLTDKFVFAILNEAIEYGPALLNDLSNYTLREKIMYAAALALSGITTHGRVAGDWGVHSLGHNLSALYDTPHGVTLAIVYPAWLRHLKDRMTERIANLGKAVFGTEDPEETISALESFFRKLDVPVQLDEAGIAADKKEEIIRTMVENKSTGNHFKLNESDVRAIVDRM